MKETGRKSLLAGVLLLGAFVLWTILIQCVDVQAVGPKGTTIGFAAFNVYLHALTGVHMALYAVTDWLGLVPVFVCLCFAALGFVQLVKRRRLLQVDPDLLLLGVYYALVIAAYLIFEMVPINFRPVLIGGRLEASYPSSTTLLVLSVMPTLRFQTDRRTSKAPLRKAAALFSAVFSAFMVIGRWIAGVHWTTDILASVLLSTGLYMLYRAAVSFADGKRRKDGIQ
jgi:undecaprenyl-diphosphatase